jgi:hypothetical protein
MRSPQNLGAIASCGARIASRRADRHGLGRNAGSRRVARAPPGAHVLESGSSLCEGGSRTKRGGARVEFAIGPPRSLFREDGPPKHVLGASVTTTGYAVVPPAGRSPARPVVLPTGASTAERQAHRSAAVDLKARAVLPRGRSIGGSRPGRGSGRLFAPDVRPNLGRLRHARDRGSPSTARNVAVSASSATGSDGARLVGTCGAPCRNARAVT